MTIQQFILLLLATLISIPLFAESSETRIECEGNHSETGEPVYGECRNGEFTGYFSRTGKPVYGKCDAHGKLRAYDPETGKMVLGRCE